MTMRRHKRPQNQRKIAELSDSSKQSRIVLEAWGKLLGIGTDLEMLLKSRDRLQQQAMKRMIKLKPAQTDADRWRLACAAARRVRQNGERAYSWARSLRKNKALTWSDYMATVRVANKLHVDKLSLAIHTIV